MIRKKWSHCRTEGAEVRMFITTAKHVIDAYHLRTELPRRRLNFL